MGTWLRVKAMETGKLVNLRHTEGIKRMGLGDGFSKGAGENP